MQVQIAADAKPAEPSGVAGTPPAATVIIPDQQAATAARDLESRTTQAQPSVTGIALPVTPAAAGTVASAGAAEAVASASLSQQASQQANQSPASANAAAAGSAPGASAPSGTAGMLPASATVTCVAPSPSSKPLADLAG